MKIDLELHIDHKLLREISVLFCFGLVVLTFRYVLNGLFYSFYFKCNCGNHCDKKRFENMLLCNACGILLSRTYISIKKICCSVFIYKKSLLFWTNEYAHKFTIRKSRLKIYSTFKVWILNQRILSPDTHWTVNIRIPCYCFTFFITNSVNATFNLLGYFCDLEKWFCQVEIAQIYFHF